MKKVIRLTESDLHKIIKNSVKRILRENQEKVESLADLEKPYYNLMYALDTFSNLIYVFEEQDKHIMKRAD